MSSRLSSTRAPSRVEREPEHRVQTDSAPASRRNALAGLRGASGGKARSGQRLERTGLWNDRRVFAPDPDMSLLSENWTDVRDSAEAQELEGELVREVSLAHVLAGRPMATVAARKLRKEVIFKLTEENRWVWVHLTWRPETDPRWPSSVICDSWASLISELADAGRG